MASSNAAARTSGRGLDPWLLADALGGRRLTLGSGGSVDLIALNITSVIGQVVRVSDIERIRLVLAMHDIRIRVNIPGAGASEISPGLTFYRPVSDKTASPKP